MNALENGFSYIDNNRLKLPTLQIISVEYHGEVSL